MASTSTSPVNNDGVRYCQTLDLVIENFHKTQKQVDMSFQVSACNEELKPYGEEMRRSRWILKVARREEQSGTKVKYMSAFLALLGNGNIELMAEKTVFRIVGKDGESLSYDDMVATSFKGADVKQRQLGLTDYKRICQTPLRDLIQPCGRYTPQDCLHVRAEIIFTVISGGTPPARKEPTHLLVMPDSLGPAADEHIMKSSDGRRFRVKKHLLTGIPYFDGIVKTIKNPSEGITLGHDGETLEFVFESLKAKRVMNLEMSKKVLIAANSFGLKELQTEAINQLIPDRSIEKVADAFDFATENNIQCLRSRIAVLGCSLRDSITGANAAKALVLSVKIPNLILRKRALDVIAGEFTNLYLAGGFEEIASIPGLAAEVRTAVANRSVAEKNDDTQNGAPAKRAKTSS